MAADLQGNSREVGTVLVVDDDMAVGQVLAALLRQAGHRATHTSSAEDALVQLRSGAFDVVISDLKLGGMDGMDLLRNSVREWPDVPFVLLTAYGTVAIAVEAMKAGAADFFLKPFDREEVLFTVDSALARGRARQTEPPRRALAGGRLLGNSAPMVELDALLERAASSAATVLLRGETGTGKELAARTLHEKSARHNRPFIAVNCAALPENLLESELFGHEKGAFTGAATRKPGRVELADGGTLFLDEIGDLPASVQVKLLRLLQERQYEAVGATRAKQADVRFVAATHRDLDAMVEAGTFREDLFYRLNVLPIWLPALRERLADIPLIAGHVCDKVTAAHGRPKVRFSPEALAALARHPWPGNVREFENFVERIVILHDEAVISAELVQRELGRRGSSARTRAEASVVVTSESVPLEVTRASAEREAVVAALRRAGNSRTIAARILGVSRRTLYNKLAEYGLG